METVIIQQFADHAALKVQYLQAQTLPLLQVTAQARVDRSRELMDHFTTTAETRDILSVFGVAWVVSDFTSCIKRATHEKFLRLALLI
jgi:hypothetical protein